MFKYVLIFILSVSIATQALSQTRLPAFFSDHMVLQQQQQAAIWGTDLPNKTIAVSGSWGEKATAVSDAKGQWKLKLQTPKAGGPYTLVVKGSKELTFKNILIGEVWFCSGQSNMEMPIKGYAGQPIIGSNEAILNSSNDQIRFFTSSRFPSITPLTDIPGEWKMAGPATTGNFSATAYFFAKKLQSILGIPIGIIHSSWGGSNVESWMDKSTLAAFPKVAIPDTVPKLMPNRVPTIMYNTMVSAYIGYTIKGMTWYQGEGNRENAQEYLAMFTAMIQSWRTQWQQGDFPFYFAQIAPFEPGKPNGAILREAQLKTMQTVKNTGMVVTMDIGDRTVIHPAQKEQVGHRLAYWALAKDYDVKGIAFSGPVFKEIRQVKDGRMTLFFDFCDQGLASFGKPLTDFEIAGEDKIFYPATAQINRDNPKLLMVWSDSVKNPVSVRYAFKNWAEASLFNTQGLPASSFRTDNW